MPDLPPGSTLQSQEPNAEKPAETDTRPHWIGILIAVAVTVAGIILVSIEVQPAATAGLVDLVIAATAFPSMVLWASRISNIELVQSTARSAKARNEIIGLGLTSLRDDIRASADGQARAIVSAVAAAQVTTEEAGRNVVREIRALGDTIRQASTEEVRALGESRAATERQAEAARQLAELQRQAIERARPQLHAQTQVRSAWIFFHHNWVLIASIGSPARGVAVSYRFLQQNEWTRLPVAPFDLETQGQREFDLGDVSTAGGSNRVWIMLRYRDDANFLYVANIDLPLGGNQWSPFVAQRLT